MGTSSSEPVWQARRDGVRQRYDRRSHAHSESDVELGAPDATALVFEARVLPAAFNPDYYSRKKAELRAEPYYAAIVPPIAEATFQFDSSVLAEVDDASNAIARFDAELTSFPAPFAAVLLRSESASSSQIEMLTAGARAIAEAEIGERVEGNAPQIVQNVRAVEAAVALSGTIDNHTIIEMHRALLGEKTPALVGGYRMEQVWIGGDLPHDATFVPPHHARVQQSMDDLVMFAHRTDLPVLVQAAIAHAQFETIHPFSDGNGRTGRALIQAMLRNGRLLRHMTIPVSAGLLTDLERYFDALNRYRVGDATAIIQACANATFSGLENARHLAADIESLQKTWQDQLAGLRSDASARRLATVSIEHPVLNTKVAQGTLGTSAPATLNALDQLVERGILKPANSKKRNRLWINQEVIDALDAFAVRTGRRQHPDY